MELNYKPEESMRALIQMGTNGHFPLFFDSWLKDPEVKERRFHKITGQERVKAKKLFKEVSKHQNLERKRIVLTAMKDEDRKLFMKAFFKLVEGKILDKKMELH